MNYGLKIKNLLVCGFVLLVMAAMTVGDEPQVVVQPLKAEAPDNNALAGTVDNAALTNTVKSTAGATALSTAATIQSITFKKDAGIRDALRFLAAKYQKNIVLSPKVDGLIAVSSLYDVTFEEAMDAILGHGFRYEQEGNFIKVYTEEEYKQIREDKSRRVHRVFTLCYVNAAEVKALITPLLSESGKIGTTTAAAVDTEAGQGGDKPSMRDTIVVYDFPERLDQIGRMIKEIDIKPQQILIEVTVLKVTLTEDTEFGINWDTIGGVTLTTGMNGISVGLTNSSASGGLTFGFANDKFVSLITALESIQNATVLANPKIMALNKQAGFINIGSQTGYTESTTQNSTGTTSSIAFLDSGTILRFRPFICDNGYIRMEINPEESTATTTDVNSGGITTVIPSKTLTQVKTNIMVKDGRTIIIGGLFREELTSNDSQVPIVGDLPIIGALFKKTSDKNVRDELIILITPHIINEPEDLASATEKKMDDISRLVNGSRKRISSLARVRIYEDTYAKAVEYYANKEYDKALAELNGIIGFRPDVLEAVRLKEKILTEVQPDRYRALERIMLDQIRKEQDVMWKR